jgi:hypothetical protein
MPLTAESKRIPVATNYGVRQDADRNARNAGRNGPRDKAAGYPDFVDKWDTDPPFGWDDLQLPCPC